MGEFELLSRVREMLGPPGPRVALGSGDDAAVTVPGGATATSVDAVVEGVHFELSRTSPAAVGVKALATALSDLAAMGATAGEAYAVVGVPEGFGEVECLELVEGMADLAAETGTTLAGGDLTRSPALFLAITVVGHAAEASRFVTRAGARPGDLLLVTGELGAAAAGLLVLEEEGRGKGLGPEARERLLERQRRPRPRLEAGIALAAAGARAMIDISDGIGGDARHLAEASDVGLLLDTARLPVAAGVAEVAAAAGEDPLRLAVSGGEDYELLAAVPAEGLEPERLGAAAGTAVTVVGEVVAGSGVEIRLPGGRTLDPSGFEQLS